jgi:hypothetical protein
VVFVQLVRSGFFLDRIGTIATIHDDANVMNYLDACTCEKATDAGWNPVEHETDFTTKA